MAPMIEQLVAVQEEAAQEVEDLRLDAAALQQTAGRYSDASLQMVIHNRLRILASGLQTAAQLTAQAESTRMTVLQHCQTIDQLLTVTLPAWRLMPK